MKQIALALLLLIAGTVEAQVKAFPTADGFGEDAFADKSSAIVLFVDNLDNSGAGSLRDALEATGERIVIPRICGVVDIGSNNINVAPDLYFAGQAAPGDGLCVTGDGAELLNIGDGGNIIIRGLRLRPDNAIVGGSRGISIAGARDGGGTRAEDVILDHCSFSFASNINIAIIDTCSRITIQDCIFATPLEGGGGGHNANFSVESIAPIELEKRFLTEFTLARNLFLHATARSPKYGYYAEVMNNVTYNHDNFAMELNGYALVDLIGNVFLEGPESGTGAGLKPVEISNTDLTDPEGPPWDTASSPSIRAYIKDNMENFQTGHGTAAVLTEVFTNIVDASDPSDFCFPNCQSFTRLTLSGLEPMASEFVLDYVLANAGAFPRDAFDAQYVLDVVEDNPGIISAIPSMDSYSCGAAETDTDSDGMPDYWEEQRGHDRNVPSNTLDLNENGYTDIEDYINAFLDGEQFAPTTSQDRHIIRKNQ